MDRDHKNRHLHFRGRVHTYEELCQVREGERIAERELGEERWRAKHERCERAIAALGETLAQADPDVVVIVGDDQREMFLDDGIPAIAVFWGETVDCIPRPSGRSHPSIEAADWANHGTRRLYTDPAIFEAEMRGIFERTWVFIGHESEVPRPGDFKTTYMGRNPVIMSRDRDGQIYVLMNRCMHRGAVVCREERGNAPGFRCSYHGWTYNSRGDLAVVTARGGYGPDFEQEALGLIRAPRVESYRGFVFACLDPGVEPLDRHLGRARYYFDLGLDLAPEGEIEVRSGVQRYAYAANWKFQIENWPDHYHARIVHESAFALRGRGPGNLGAPDPVTGEYAQRDTGWVTSLPHGINTEKTRGAAGLSTFGGSQVPEGEEYLRRLTASRGEERARELTGSDIQMMVFPNFFIQPRRQHFRVLRPVAVDRTEVWAYPYTLKGAPDEFNRRMVEDMAWWASAAGFGQPDDLEQFARCQEGLQVTAAEWVLFNRGMHLEERLPEGEIRGESETTHRGIYREWKRLMGGCEE